MRTNLLLNLTYLTWIYILLLAKLSHAFHKRITGSDTQTISMRLQQDSSDDFPGTTSDNSNDNNGESSADGTIITRIRVDADDLAPESDVIVSIFNAEKRLRCVQGYMTNSDVSSLEFCPNFVGIARSSSDNIDNELALISTNEESNAGRAQEIYRDLRSKFNKPLMGIVDAKADIAFVSNTFDNEISLNDVLVNLLGFSSRYRDLNSVLGIPDNIKPDAFGCDYNEIDYSISEGPYCLVYLTIDAQYAITGGTLYLNRMIIDSTDYKGGIKKVNYEGILRLKNYFDLTDEQQANIDKNIPIKIKTISTDIDSFDLNNPSFSLAIYPEDGQIDIATLLKNLLDQTSINIPTPRGLSSVNLLSVSSAIVDIRSRLSNTTVVNTQAPDFNILSEGISLKSVTGKVETDNSLAFVVTFNGDTQIGSVPFYSTMVKKIENRDYVVNLKSQEGKVLTYPDLKGTVFPSISVNEINMFPTNEHAKIVLDRLNINEGGIHYAKPVMKIRFRPYSMYNLEGFHDTNGDAVEDCFIQANMVNLDGSVVAYSTYLFDYSKSEPLFKEAFNVVNTDAASKSILYTKLKFTTYNRDFDLTQYGDLQNTDFGDTVNTEWKKGLRVSTEIDLKDNCEDNAFCNFMKRKVQLNEPIELVGNLKTDITLLTNTLPDISFSPLMTLIHPDLQLLVRTNLNNESMQNLRLQGNLEVTVEQGRNVTFNTYIKYDDVDPAKQTLTGSVFGIYEDIFGMDNLLDLLSIGIDGDLPSTGTLYDYNITSLGVLGHGWYTNQTLLDALSNQASGKELDNVYSYSSEDPTLETFIDKNKWEVGDLYLFINEEPSFNRIESTFKIDRIKRLLTVVLDAMPGDDLPKFLNDIDIKSGLAFDISTTVAHPNDGLRQLVFTGIMSVYGIEGSGVINSHIDEGYADLTVHLPNFSLGSGNIQFVSPEDIRQFLGLYDGQDISNEIRSYSPESDVTNEENTITATMEIGNLENTDIRINANIRMFDIFHRIPILVNEDRFSISMPGRPFNGRFNAVSTANIKVEEDLQNELNSNVAITLNMDDNIVQLKNNVNTNLGKWVDSIVQIFRQLDKEAQNALEAIIDINSKFYEETEWVEYSHWIGVPTLQWKTYATEKVCVQNKSICDLTTYKCTETAQDCTLEDVHGVCLRSITVCTKWENACEGGQKDIWVMYEDRENPNLCLEYELTCDRTVEYDPECIAGSQYLQRQKTELQNQYIDITNFNESIYDLYATASNIINLSQGLNGYIELVNIISVTTDTELDRVLSGDSFNFIYATTLYSEWSEKYYNLIHSAHLVNELVPEDQLRDDMDAKIIKFDTKFDFNSIEKSADLLTERIERVVWEIFGVYKDEALQIQKVIRSFGLLDGNSTICPLFEVYNDPIKVASEDGEGGLLKPSMTVLSKDQLDSQNEQATQSVEQIVTEKITESGIPEYTYTYTLESS